MKRDELDISYSEFRDAIRSSIEDKLRERLERERQIISNTILGDSPNGEDTETQSNADDN